MITSPLPFPWPADVLTIADWEQLPEAEAFRLELVEGVLTISPRPHPLHQDAILTICYRLREQLPVELRALNEVEVVVSDGPPTIRVPDVIVTPTSVFRSRVPRFAARDVALAVEVLSEGTRRVDRVMKFSEYAEAGIPQYWIIDLDAPASLLAYTLVGDSYELSQECPGIAELTVAHHAITIDLGELLAD